MRRFGSHFCGAVILNSDWALCAAHCTDSGTNRDYEIVAGEHQLSTPSSAFQKVAILQIKNHEKFEDPLDESNDISLLRLASKLEFNENVTPACKPRDINYTGKTVTISGWGKTQPERNSPDTLVYTNVKVISDANCNQMYPGEVDETMICAAAAGRDACGGDSGGPMAYNNNGRFEIIGLTSWGKGCARPDNPGVYAKISHQLEWIQKNAV